MFSLCLLFSYCYCYCNHFYQQIWWHQEEVLRRWSASCIASCYQVQIGQCQRLRFYRQQSRHTNVYKVGWCSVSDKAKTHTEYYKIIRITKSIESCSHVCIRWSVRIPMAGAMTIGFDISKDTADKKKAYGCLVATMDLRQHIEFFSHVTELNGIDKIGKEFAISVVSAVRYWKEKYGNVPRKIIIYRGGVGEGDLNYLEDTEVESVKSALSGMYPNVEDLQICYIVVTKKITTRLFRGDMNPEPGTVVDDVITLAGRCVDLLFVVLFFCCCSVLLFSSSNFLIDLDLIIHWKHFMSSNALWQRRVFHGIGIVASRHRFANKLQHFGGLLWSENEPAPNVDLEAYAYVLQLGWPNTCTGCFTIRHQIVFHRHKFLASCAITRPMFYIIFLVDSFISHWLFSCIRSKSNRT